MQTYLLSIYQPDGGTPEPAELERIMTEVGALIGEMKDEGVWVFDAGLHPPATATVVQVRDGDALITDGPYLEGKEHVGGFTVIRADDLDAALHWARRVAEVLSPLHIEVRPFAA